ncbi:hypothetical protein FOZ62_016214 [Perkinsus olseni]|uniref:RING-type domain-containing protein n=1 Tax=Perkinsus olseni TaxID=32597 RepID=A0A7J6NQ28_PEROL|nr:hypothetical protein FOZ62_016214 [Perkinsus olseni]
MNYFPPPSPFPNAGRALCTRPQPTAVVPHHQQQQQQPQGSGDIDRRQILPQPGCLFVGAAAIPVSPMLSACTAVTRQVSCISPTARIDDLPILTYPKRHHTMADSVLPEGPATGKSSSSSTVSTRGGNQSPGNASHNGIRLNTQNSNGDSSSSSSQKVMMAERKTQKEWSQLPQEACVIGLIDSEVEEEVGRRLDSAAQLFEYHTKPDAWGVSFLLSDLRSAVASHTEKCELTHEAVIEEVKRFESLECRLIRRRQRTLHGKSELSRLQQELKRYRGEELEGVPPEEVEAIADRLATALSKATVRQAALEGSGQVGSSQTVDKDMQKVDRMVSQSDDGSIDGAATEEESATKVYNAVDLADKTVETCDALIEEITKIREKAVVSSECLKESWARLEQLRADCNRYVKDYDAQKEEYLSISESLLAARRSKSLLMGEYDMQGLTSEELEGVCSTIVKATRKVHLALAMRQLQQQRSNDADTSSSGLGLRQGLNDPLCIVCFENMWNTSLSPCGHVLCADCSSRLKYCPTCRHPIQARQRIYM